MDTDRNLLFGALAFQDDYIDLAQFAAVCRAWSADKSRPLAALLLEKGWIDATARAELERKVERKVKRYGGDVHATLGATADYAVRDAIRDVADPEIRHTMGALPPAAGHVLVETLVKPTEERSRYTLTRLHGEGGLGKVWVARDGDLNREVALKELRPEQGVHAEACHRFLKEAQVTGQLEHPNIVPVYELARRPQDDQPFYTMRFVHGQTLRGAISDYHRRRHDRVAGPLDFARLLQAFVSVCHAIAYAHSRSVVHRDLKPDNVVLGGFGEVIVLDWGLAKLVGQPDEDAAPAADQPLPVAVTDLAGAERTMAGRVLGTPAYMAPEQAEGRIDLIDSRTDIYGLGAILFEILTGLPPHQGKNTAELLGRIVAGESPRARSLEPSAAPALEAICAKAMARVRSQRYAKASELADDVQRWLADEPVSAHRESWSQRAARWLRRHRTWAQAAAAALLLVTAISVAATLVVNESRRGEAKARAEAEAARDEAMRRFEQAFAAVDLLRETADLELQDLRFYPRVQGVRKRLLEDVADAFEHWATEKSDNKLLRAESANAFVRLGLARESLGDLDGAQRSYQSAGAAFTSLLASDENSAEYRLGLANSHTRLGIVAFAAGRHDDASRHHREAIDGLAPLVRGDSADPRHRDALATCRVNLGLVLRVTGRYADALATLKLAVSEFDDLLKKDPDKPRYWQALATARNNLGQMLSTIGRNVEAEREHRAALALFQRLIDQQGGVPDYIDGRATSQVDLASALSLLGRDAEAVVAYLSAIRDYEDLREGLGPIPRYRRAWALAACGNALLMHQHGREAEPDEARSILEKAILLLETLIEPYPDIPEYREGLAAARMALGEVLRDAGENAAAKRVLQAALDDLTTLVKAEPAAVEHAERRAACQALFGRVLAKLGNTADARSSMQSAIDEYQRLLAATPEVPSLRDGLAWCWTHFASPQFGESKQSATDDLAQAIAIRNKLVADFLDAALYHSHLAWLLANCTDPRQRDPVRAIAEAEQATRQAPLASAYWNSLGAARYRAGDFMGCVNALQQSVQLRGEGEAIGWFFLAMARSKLNDQEGAREAFQLAVQWMDRHRPDDEELVRLRAEAAQVTELAN